MTRDPNHHPTRARPRTALKLALLLAALALSACSGGPPDRLWLPAETWSRAIAVGRSSTGGRPALLLETGRALLYLSGPRSDPSPSLVSLPYDQAGQPQVEAIPGLAGRLVGQPMLVRSGTEYRLYWLEGASIQWISWQDDPGNATEPRSVNIAGGVADYGLAAGPQGQVSLWLAGTEEAPGLYVFSHGGLSPEDPVIDPEGQRPSVAAGETAAHAVWFRPAAGGGQAELLYSSLPWDSRDPSEPVTVARRAISPSDVTSGPWIAVDHEYAYVFFTIEIRTGLRAGQTDTTLHIFPLNDPSQVRQVGERVFVQTATSLGQADPAESGASERTRTVWEPDSGRGLSSLTQLYPNPQRAPEAPVALVAKLPYLRNQEQLQIVVVYLESGEPAGTNVITFTASGSTQPVLATDPQDHLHLLWLERGEDAEQIVYYASTRPEVIDALAGITGDDLGRMASATAFSMVSGLLFTPLALLWLILPAILIIATSFLRQEGESFNRRGSLLSIGLAVAAYWGVKLLVMPALLQTTPFPDWYPVIPVWMAAVLRVAVPLLISALALFLAHRFTYERGRHSPLFMVLLFGLIDGALTMAIFAGILIGGL